MKTLSSAIETQRAAEQSGWCELVDIYLKSSVTTPWGSASTLRLTTNPGTRADGGAGMDFFTPQIDPEPAGTQGDAAEYDFWPLKRQPLSSRREDANDKLTLVASNVTAEWATMLAAVDWHDTFIIIRKTALSISGATADDCVTLFIGQVDSAVITLEQIQLTCSNALSLLSAEFPSENMHQNCRFGWGDDQCTALKFKAANYKTGTCGSGSTTTRVKSSDFTEDGAARRYVDQSVTADSSTDKITLSSHLLNDGDQVSFGGTAVPGGLTAGTWYFVRDKATNDFKVAATAGGTAINLTSNGTSVTVSSETLYGADLVGALSSGAITASSEVTGYVSQAVTLSASANVVQLASHRFSKNDPFFFDTGTLPAELSLNTTYYARPKASGTFSIMDAVDGEDIDISGAGSGVKITSGSYGATSNFQANQVRVGQPNYWKFNTAADWGTLTNGYYIIPDAQAGLANPLLKPYITFDFGSAKAVKTWLIQSVPDLRQEELIRQIVLFSSTSSDFSTGVTHEGYFEMPPKGGEFFEMLVPAAQSARYWRICVRSRWAESIFYTMFNKIRAFENGVQYWTSGRITFASNTTTAALRNQSAIIRGSYTGEVEVGALPSAPASGDTFTIARGCPRTWNGCNERRNWENFGGFLDLPTQTVIR